MRQLIQSFKVCKEDNLEVQVAIHVLTCSRNPFDSLLSYLQGMFPCVGYIDKVSLKSKHLDILTRVNSFSLLWVDGNVSLLKLHLGKKTGSKCQHLNFAERHFLEWPFSMGALLMQIFRIPMPLILPINKEYTAFCKHWAHKIMKWP